MCHSTCKCVVSTSIQPHNKNFLFTKNATKPNAYWDIVELTAFLQDEGHENDKKDPIKEKLSFNMLLKIRCANWQI